MSEHRFARYFRFQAAGCRHLESPVWGDLLARCEADLAAGGPTAALLEDWEGDAGADNLPLRLAGAMHFLALCGRAPELAAVLPSTGGQYEPEAAWGAWLALERERAGELRALLREPIQTNEVQRCCALLGGFLECAHGFARPLRLLEVGASAGLNQLFDRYRYELGGTRLGDPSSPLALQAEWRGAPLVPVPFSVASREGCDPSPIDLADPERRLRLLSFVWPEQADRLARLREAFAIAEATPPRVTRARADAWLASRLAEPAPGVTSVVFHSVVWWYVPQEERERILATLRAAGARATREAPLAWLRMENEPAAHAELRLTLWPGGEERLLGRTHWHGRWVEWLGG
jgi:hypothetical protein